MTVLSLDAAVERIAQENGWTRLPRSSTWTKGKRKIESMPRGFTVSGPKKNGRYAYRDCFSGKLQDTVDIFEERSTLWEDIVR